MGLPLLCFVFIAQYRNFWVKNIFVNNFLPTVQKVKILKKFGGKGNGGTAKGIVHSRSQGSSYWRGVAV